MSGLKSSDVFSSHNSGNALPKNNSPTTKIHPWYYVPGKSYLSEKHLSLKRENESRRRIKNEEANKFFMKYNSETKLFSNWEKNKPMIKYFRPKTNLSSPFYLNDIETQNLDKKNFQIYYEKTSNLFKVYNDFNSKQKYIDLNPVIKFLYDFMKIYNLIKTKRMELMKEIHTYLYEATVKHFRDPLRQVCFLIKEVLYFYKNEIFNVIKLHRSLSFSNFLLEQEQNELHELNNRCFQIIDMYIQLNEIRNEHFQTMFNEEKDKIWQQQKHLWKKEVAIWDNLIVKLLKSNYLLIKDKLKSSLKCQKQILNERLTKFEYLKNFIEEIDYDNNLKPILYIDIGKLTKQS